MSNRFCSVCGKDLSQYASVLFCPGCGTRIQNTQAAPPQSAAQSPIEQQPAVYQTPLQQPGAYQPMPSYGSSQYGVQPMTVKRTKTGGVIAICAGVIVLLAAITFFFLRVKPFTSRFSGEPTELNGSWEAVLHIEQTKGDSSTAQALRSEGQRDYEQILEIFLGDDGTGLAELTQDGESSGQLKAKLTGGTLVFVGKEDLIFNFKGKVGEGGDTIEGEFKLSAGEEDDATVIGTLKATKSSSNRADIASKTPEQKSATFVPEATPETKPEATPQPTEPPKPQTGNAYLEGEWLGEPYPDGMSDVFIFNQDGSCENIPTVMKDDGTMDGWKTGAWYTEEKWKGHYTYSGGELTIEWADFSRSYTLDIVDDITFTLTEYYDGGSITMKYSRIIS